MTAAARPRPHRMFVSYAAAGLAVALLGACTSGDPGPAVTTAPTATSSPSPTSAPPTTTTSAPSPTASIDPVLAKIPAAARANSQQGAEAFAMFFMDQVNEAFTKPDPAALGGLATANCKPCMAFVDGARQLEKQGHRHDGRSITPDGAVANSFAGSKAVIAIYVTQHSVKIVDKTGTKVDQTKAGSGTFVATMSFNSHWKIEQLQVAK